MLHCVESLCVTKLSDLVPYNLNQFEFGCFARYCEKIQLHIHILIPKSITHPVRFCHTNIHLPFLSLLFFLSVKQKLHSSSVYHITTSPQVYPLQVSASPRYSGFSAVGVTNPFMCLGTPPSLSSASGPSKAPATALALATRSR